MSDWMESGWYDRAASYADGRYDAGDRGAARADRFADAHWHFTAADAMRDLALNADWSQS